MFCAEQLQTVFVKRADGAPEELVQKTEFYQVVRGRALAHSPTQHAHVVAGSVRMPTLIGCSVVDSRCLVRRSLSWPRQLYIADRNR